MAIIVIEIDAGQPWDVAVAVGEIMAILGNPDPTTLEFVIRPRHGRRKPASVSFAVPTLTSIHGGPPVMAITIPNDAIATVKLNFADNVGNPLAGEAASVPGVSVSVADPTVASAVLAADGQSVTITPLMLAGGSTVNYADTNDNITATLDFALGAPVPATATFDEAGVSLTKNPSPPTA